MKTMVRRLSVAATVVVVFGLVNSAQAAAPNIYGDVRGIELLPQSGGHGAVFIFEFEGSPKDGWGWVEVLHESPLPTSGSSVDITGGRGVLWVGWRRYQIVIPAEEGGTLTAADDDDNLFNLEIAVMIGNWRGYSPHFFVGRLSHQVFPPVIGGLLMPIP